jgi:hypothetical protein
MNRKERGWGGMDWIDLVQDRDQWRTLLNMVMHLGVPEGILEWLNDWRLLMRAKLHRVS